MESTDIKYEKIKGFANTKGQTFESKMVALLFLRGVNSGLEFRLASNVAGAGALDDVVFQYKPSGQSTWTTCFVQMKHKESAWVTLRALTHAKGDFALVKYFEAYRDIKQAMSSLDEKPFFDGSVDESTFVLFTNSKASTDLGEGRSVEFGTAEEFLASNSGSVLCFDPDGNRKSDTAILECLAAFQDDAKDFMKRLRVFCGQPSENGFDKLIKDELQKMENVAIEKINIDRLCECLVDNVSAWSEKSNKVIHAGSSLLANALNKVVVETCFAREKGAEILDVSFADAALSTLKSVLNDNLTVLLVESSEKSSCLSCTKFLQEIDGSHLFLGARCLLEKQKSVLSEWRRGKLRYLAISTRNLVSESVPYFVEIIKEVCNLADGSDKRVLVFSGNNIEVMDALRKEMTQLTKMEDSFDFSQLKDESREKILKKTVSFQNHVTSLLDVVGDARAQDQVIDASALVAILRSDGVLTAGPVLPDEVSYYVPRTLERSRVLKRNIFTVDQLAESMTIVHSTEQDIISFFWPRVALENPQSIYEALEKISEFPPNTNEEPSNDETTVFVGQTSQIGNYECSYVCLRNGLPNRVTALRVRPNKGPPVGWFLFLKAGTSQEDVALFSEFNRSKHWLSLENNLHWLKSHNDMEIIREYVDETQGEILDAENVELLSDRLVLLCAEPGMGKSTLMSRLAKKTKDANPSFWVIVLSLSDHSQLFAQRKHNDAFTFLSEVAKIKSDFERSLLKFHLEITGKVIVLVDGFDEIAPKYADQCCTLITNLLKTNAKKIWITSRNSTKSYLEDHLTTLATKIHSFNKADQRRFLKQYWAKKSTLSEKELDDFIDLLVKSMTRAISADFLGIPLQMRIIAEVYEDNLRGLAVNTTLPERLDLLQLMEKFVNKKLLVYVQEKLKIKPDEPKYDSQLKTNKKEFIKNHSYAALVLILSDEDLKELHSKKILKKATAFFNEIARCHDDTGIIDSIVNDKPRFIHRVFAEHFVARWFIEHLYENAHFLQTRLHLPDFAVVRTIFDLGLAKDCELHTAVLNEDLEEVKTLLGNGVDVTNKDLGGRIALHLVAAFGPSDDRKVNTRRAAILEQLLAKTTDFNIEDAVYKATPLRYADMTQSWNAIDKLLPHYRADCKRHLVDTLKNVANKAMVVKICTHDLVNLLNVCVSEGLSVDIKSDSNDARKHRLLMAQNGSSRVASVLAGISPEGEESLHHAASRGDVVLLKALLQNATTVLSETGNNGSLEKDFVDFVNKGDKNGWTALHHASFHGHVPVVIFLIEQGADISSREGMQGYTPLHMAAGLGRPSVAESLLRAVEGKERIDYLKAGTTEGRTALHLAVETGHSDVVKILVEATAEDGPRPRPPSPKKESNNLSEVPTLLDDESRKVSGTNAEFSAVKAEYINVKDHMGRTALHDAAWHANEPLLSYLIHEGGNVKSVTGFNGTPLHWAARFGDAKTVKVLLDAVEEDGRADFTDLRENDGNTALHGAVWEGRWEAAKFIIEAGGKVTVANHAGQTPLMAAAEKGHRDIVFKLLDGFVEVKEGMSKKDYINMRDKDGRTVLDFVSGDMVGAITSHMSEVFDFDVD